MRYSNSKIITKYYNNHYQKVIVMSRKPRIFHRLFTPQKLGKCSKLKIMPMLGMELMMALQKMQLITNLNQ
jgi:hypothetical protein